MKRILYVLTPGVLYLLMLIIEFTTDNHFILLAISLSTVLFFYGIIYSFYKSINDIKNIDLDEKKLSNRVTIKGRWYDGLSKKINELMTSNETSIAKISHTASKLADMSVRLQHDISEIQGNKTIMEASTTMNEIIQDVNGQVAASEEISGTIKNLVEGIQSINNNAHLTKSLALETLSDSEVGFNNLNKNIEKINSIDLKMSLIDKETLDLRNYTKNINDILSLINSISEQTNLLAFNAAVEAARAGEAGRGFAVVASEIRKLASTSKESTLEIGNILNNIVNKIELVNSSVQETKEMVIEEKESISASLQLIEKIKNKAKNVSEASDKTSTELTEETAAMEEINQALEDLTVRGSSIFEKAENQMEATKFLETHLLDSFAFSNELSTVASALKFFTKKYNYSDDALEREITFVNWTKDNSVLIDKMDEQHKVLFEITNKMGNIILNAKDNKDSLITIATDLLNYTKKHFTEEEIFLEKSNYNPNELNAQKKQHKIFIDKINDFKADLEADKKPSIEMIEFLRDWLLKHIDIEDKKYGKVLSQK